MALEDIGRERLVLNEDRLASVAGQLREVRQALADADMKSVPAHIATFELFLERCTLRATKLKNECLLRIEAANLKKKRSKKKKSG